jgi:GWxTD domain-containing protein
MADSNVHKLTFPVYASSFPHLSGIEEEIKSLAYIARSEEMDSLHAGVTPGEKRSRVVRFWQDHGGEVRQHEFYERVREANELFSSCTEGWKTPMGITYIVCGPPDYVECQGGMNEAWYYDLGGNRGFAVTFRLNTENELGRYYEIVPFSVNDFLWQQFVDRWRRQ